MKLKIFKRKKGKLKIKESLQNIEKEFSFLEKKNKLLLIQLENEERKNAINKLTLENKIEKIKKHLNLTAGTNPECYIQLDILNELLDE